MTSDAQEKLRTGGVFVKLCRVKKKKRNVWEREGSTSARKMTCMVLG